MVGSESHRAVDVVHLKTHAERDKIKKKVAVRAMFSRAMHVGTWFRRTKFNFDRCWHQHAVCS